MNLLSNLERFCILFALLRLTFFTAEYANASKHGRKSTDNSRRYNVLDLPRKGERAPRKSEKDQKRQNSSAEQEPADCVNESLICVKLDKGRYKGKVQDVLDTKVAFFLGMRYAEAPVGKHRFKKPVPTKGWRTRYAVEYPNTCYQWTDNTFGAGYPGTEMWNPNTKLSEDCLFLNVWTPLNPDFSGKRMPSDLPLLPVMVWIYGGGFYSGTSSLDVYQGQWLAAAEQVVVVSMNYRVAALGFLTFGIEDAPGNAGLWDQREALIWVRDNIRRFRGDPSRVTLFGESAGAASISMHMLSDKSTGLFQNAILQSASAFSPWAILPMHVMKKRANNLARLLKCDVSYNNTRLCEKELMECMFAADPLEMVNEEIGVEVLGTARFQNAAVIDEDFLTGEAIEKLKSGSFVTDVNILAGFNANEGNYFLIYGTKGFTNITSDSPITYFQYFEGLKRGLRGYPWRPMEQEQQASYQYENDVTLDAIDFQYTNFENTLSDRKQKRQLKGEFVRSSDNFSDFLEDPKTNNYKQVLDRIVGDINFVCPVIKFMKKCSVVTSYFGSGQEPPSLRKNILANKFLYRFLHRSSQTPWPEWMGTLHGYEIEFIFGIPLNEKLKYTKEEIELARIMMKYWGNFAKSGNPNSPVNGDTVFTRKDFAEWPEYEEDREESIAFSIEAKIATKAIAYVEQKANSKQCSFWNDYYQVLQKNVDDLRLSLRKTSHARSSVSSLSFALNTKLVSCCIALLRIF